VRYDAQNLSLIKAALGADFNPPAKTGNCNTDLINFYTYFFHALQHPGQRALDPADDNPVYAASSRLRPAARGRHH